jgi:hypothetical protein
VGTLTALAVAVGISVVGMQSAQAAPAVPTFNSAPEGYASYVGQSTCDPDPKPGVVDLKDLLLATYPSTASFGISRDCSVGGQSEHKEGRAFDWGVSASTQGHIANDFLNWLLATRDGYSHALLRRFGIMYIIWNRQIFRAYRASEGWQPYSGSNPHTDHVHFSFGWPGALQETTWWTSRDVGPTSVIWRQSNYTTSSGGWSFGWGGSSVTDCAPITGDWDGDGDTTPGLACYSDTNGWTWNQTNYNASSGSSTFGWGGTARAFCFPITGDWDGDGDTTVGLSCPTSNGWIWHQTNYNASSGSTSFGWGGVTSDTTYPITGDWDGDGDTTVGLARLTSNGWSWGHTNYNASSSSWSYGWGSGTLTNAIPITGDWDGNGTDTIGLATHTSDGWIWRHSNYNASSSSWSYGWGSGTLSPSYYTPITGDWNADGKTSIGIASAKRR